jgi:hypothetical protein
MTKKIDALPRPVGASVLSLLALALTALALPASSFAAPLPEGSDPVLTISPSPAVVTTTTVGNQSSPVDFVLHNESGEEAGVEKVFLEGEDAAEFSFGSANCGNLQPGNQCSASVGFKPGSLGERKTTLHVSFVGGRPEQSFEVSGTSVPAHFSLHPGSYDFGLRPTHSEAAAMTFQLENDGAAAAQVNSLNFGANSNDFWFDGSFGDGNCSGRWMQPGETCPVKIGFSPSEPRPYATQLQASAGGETFTADLSGEGGRAVVEAFPNPADFGRVTVGATGPTQTIVVHNSGNVPAAFFIGIIAGGDAGSFQLLDESCSAGPLLPAGSCTAHVRFTPRSAGPKQARLAFFGDSEGGAMVGLSGEGVAAAVTLLPSGYDFGSAAPGSKSVPQSFAVRNEGDTPLDLGAVAVVGADLDQFVLSGEDCSEATLEPGGECVARVRFAPDSTGVKMARLRVASDAGSFTASLAGTGAGAGQPSAPAAGAAAATAGNSASTPGRHRGRHHRFSRGDAVASVRGRSPRRGDLRTSTVPR